MSENSDEPPVNKIEEAIHHFYMMNKLLICPFYSKLKNPKVYYPAILYSIHSHYCVFKE